MSPTEDIPNHCSLSFFSPIYVNSKHTTHYISAQFDLFQKTIYGANVVIFEGILAFARKEMLPVTITNQY